MSTYEPSGEAAQPVGGEASPSSEAAQPGAGPPPDEAPQPARTPHTCVAFVWHMHQPYYRSARTGTFQMPWARLHAIKDYLDMVEILAAYPTIHQTFNLVPSLVEQLEDYAAGGLPLRADEAPGSGRGGEGHSARAAASEAPAPGGADLAVPHPGGPAGGASRPAAPPVADLYWHHTIKPAADLLPSECAFVVERMCERPDHPRAKSHPRYLELAHKRQSDACKGWDSCAAGFTVQELLDLQVWFNLSWFDPTLLETEPLLGLVQKGRDFSEEDKLVLAQVQNDTFRKIIPAYRQALATGQIEVSTTPYYHPILPLLANTDSARIAAGDTILPHRRFSHPEDAWEQVDAGVAKHEQVFGARPQGMWCSEQSVGEDVLPLLMRAGIEWTISDQAVLDRSVAGSAAAPAAGGPEAGHAPRGVSPYKPYLLQREEGDVTIVFRDHTLSDLIGFGYQSWDSRDAALDLLGRIRSIGDAVRAEAGTPAPGPAQAGAAASQPAGAGTGAAPQRPSDPPLVVIALDGENAWEYYPHDGRDFLHFLYEGLAADPDIRCVTVSEYLRDHPATARLDWLHTGSWIGGDLRTWSGDPGHNAAWDLLHDARDLAAWRRRSPDTPAETAEAAWRHIMVAEGSDWFWWFGEHHHTELDYVWDLEFRQHLQEVYRRLGEPIPIRLYLPVFATAAEAAPILPSAMITPALNGRITGEDGWDKAGILPPDHPSTMQRTEGARIVEARFGWGREHLYLLLVPRDRSDLDGLEIDLTVTPTAPEDESVFRLRLAGDGRLGVECLRRGHLVGTASGAWDDVVEIALPLDPATMSDDERLALLLRVGRGGMTDHVFRSTGLAPVR